MSSGTPLRGHPSSLYNGHLITESQIVYNKPLTRGHTLYSGQFVGPLERFHCMYKLVQMVHCVELLLYQFEGHWSLV